MLLNETFHKIFTAYVYDMNDEEIDGVNDNDEYKFDYVWDREIYKIIPMTKGRKKELVHIDRNFAKGKFVKFRADDLTSPVGEFVQLTVKVIEKDEIEDNGLPLKVKVVAEDFHARKKPDYNFKPTDDLVITHAELMEEGMDINSVPDLYNLRETVLDVINEREFKRSYLEDWDDF